MITPSPQLLSGLAAALRAALPAEYQNAVPALTELLSATIRGDLTAEQAAARLSSDRTLAEAIRHLAGTRVAASEAVVSFGAGSQTGDVTISGVAGRDIVINVAEPGGALRGRRFWLIAGGIALVAALVIVGLLQTRASDQGQLRQTEAAIGSDVLNNISHLDFQLNQLATAIDNLPEDTASQSFRESLGNGQLAKLRQSLAMNPLNITSGDTFVRSLLTSGADPATVQAFYDRLRDTSDDIEALLASLDNLIAEDSDQPGWLAYFREEVDLNQRRVYNSATTAHLSGLLVLQDVRYDSTVVNNQLALLRHLEPTTFAPVSELAAGLGRELEIKAALVEERAQLVARGEALNIQSIEILPDDTWEQVVGKAIARRKLGDIEGSATAFGLYGEMFEASDPTAVQYAETAQVFTRQATELGLEGGAYIYQVNPGEPGERATLQVGDIVLTLGGREVESMDSFQSALASAPANQPVSIEVLRLGSDGMFSRLSLQADGLPLGIGVMPV